MQKLGMLWLFQGYRKLFECFTLELFDSIPAGSYLVRKYPSPGMSRIVLLFEHVPGRTFIEIHAGNFYHNTSGCILVGSAVKDINADLLKDVIDSNKTLDALLALLPDDPVKIDIFENPKEFAA